MTLLFIQIMVWIITTLILSRLLYIFGITLYTYYLTDKRLKGFGNYRIPNTFFHGRVTSANLVLSLTQHPMQWFRHVSMTFIKKY
ncbi:MAG: hypothetical protein KGD65_00535 [Candidatus Lokiarchaeota archaeon]|nr:hypothetical protein [Candidatus Lokiarchaeota archaeon]